MLVIRIYIEAYFLPKEKQPNMVTQKGCKCFEAFRSVHSCSQSLVLFRLNAHNMLNTCIYFQLPPTCFGVCYTIFSETIALLAHTLYVF
jgi:hypothetical protein